MFVIKRKRKHSMDQDKLLIVQKGGFKPLPFNAEYEINARGFVRNAKTGRILKPINTYAEPMIRLALKTDYPFAQYVSGYFPVAALILLTYVGEAPPGEIPCYKDENTKNIELTNLFWGSPNTANKITDRKRKRTGMRPGRKPTVRIESKILIIRSLLDDIVATGHTKASDKVWCVQDINRLAGGRLMHYAISTIMGQLARKDGIIDIEMVEYRKNMNRPMYSFKPHFRDEYEIWAYLFQDEEEWAMSFGFVEKFRDATREKRLEYGGQRQIVESKVDWAKYEAMPDIPYKEDLEEEEEDEEVGLLLPQLAGAGLIDYDDDDLGPEPYIGD